MKEALDGTRSTTEERGPSVIEAKGLTIGQGRRFGVAASLLSALFVSLLVVGVLGIGPASAATTPRHGASITCNSIYQVGISGYMYGFTTNRFETVAWYPELQRWQGGRWVTLSAPSTSNWHVGAANRSFAPQMQSWSLGYLEVAPDYWYRIRSSYYWYANGYQTPYEATSPCFVTGIVITH